MIRGTRHRLLAVLAVALLAGACQSGQELPSPKDVPPRPLDDPEGISPTTAPSPTRPAATGGATPDVGSLDDVRLGLEVVAKGLDSPVYARPLPTTDDLLVLEQPGRVQRVSPDGTVSLYLDISDRVGSGGNEQGLLGLAVHPRFPDVPLLVIHYTDTEGDTRLDTLTTVDGGTGPADPASRTTILSRRQPASNHNGGMIEFIGGNLFVALGDGGGGGDRFGNGRDPSTLLGSILRLELTASADDPVPDDYGIPDDNPFVDGGAAPEVYLYGLRNPWRFSVDEGLLYIGDVGQNAWEEVDVVDLEADGGANLGWPITEGTHCFDPDAGCDTDGLLLPVVEYPLAEGNCAVLGGYVYRATALPPLDGHYFYSDHCSGFLRSFRYADGEAVQQRDWTEQVGALAGVTSFGLDADGELLLTTREGGRVLRLVPAG